MNAKVLNVLTKTVGVAGLGLVLYDSHRAGALRGPEAELEGKSNDLARRYLEEQKLENISSVRANAKKNIFHYFVDENLTGAFHTTGGYVKGFNEMLRTNAIPFALSVGTLIGGKGIFSKVCGAGLIAYGGIFFLQEIFGFGKKKD